MFKFVARYYETPIAEARLAIEQITTLSDVKNNEAIIDKMKNPKLERSLIVLVDFFESVAACVEARACDEAVACFAVKSDARATIDTFWPVFQVWKKTWGPDPVARTTVFVKNCETTSKWWYW
jgi:hypothetical protein